MFRPVLLKSLGVAFALAITTTGSIAAEAEANLKLHFLLPIQSNISKNILEPWAEKIQTASDNRIKIDRFYAMALGGRPPELMDQVLDGVTDITLTLSGYTPGRFPKSEAFELPFMMTEAGPTSRAYWDYMQEHMIDSDFKDYKVLAVWVHGPGMIHSTDPVRVPKDLAGVKVRAPTRVTNMMLTEIGATTVGMPIPAVPEGLSKGVIDAAAIPWEVTGALKVPELVSNHTEFGKASLYTSTLVLAMNKDVWNKLPADLQKVMMDHSGADFSEFGGAQMQRDDAPSRAGAVDLGNNIMTLTDAEVELWRTAAKGVEKKWITEMDDKEMNGAGLVDDARQLINKYSK